MEQKEEVKEITEQESFCTLCEYIISGFLMGIAAAEIHHKVHASNYMTSKEKIDNFFLNFAGIMESSTIFANDPSIQETLISLFKTSEEKDNEHQ